MPADAPPAVSGTPPIPADLAAFAGSVLGDYRAVGFHGWDHAESTVWELESASGDRAFLKSYRQPRKFVQELAAYESWLPHLPEMTPKLLGAQRKAPHALLLAKAPGVLAQEFAPSTVQALELQRQAGAFLRRLHDLPLIDADEVPVADALAMRLESWLPRFRGLVRAADIDWVTACVREALPMVAGLRRVPCHRDFTPRNWLVEQSKGEGAGPPRLYVIDFEHARFDLRVLDFERLWTGMWAAEPDLQGAFFDGYGRPLSADDEALLERHAVLGALTTIAWAREHGDEPFERHGRQVLGWLRKRL